MNNIAVVSLILYFFTSPICSTALEDDTAGAYLHPVKLLLVSSAVRDADVLADSAADGVLVVRYEASETSLPDLISDAGASLAGRKASSIGLVTHDHGAGRFYLTGSHSISLASMLASDREQAFWRELGAVIEPGGRIDIFACDLAATDEGRMLVAALSDAAGVEVAASSNPTGNASSGGDWLLETAGIDAAETYFEKEALSCFAGLLAAGEQKVINDDEDYGHFGYSVAIDGDYAIIGAPWSDGTGSAYIFHRSGKTWTQQAELLGNDTVLNDNFGWSVAISGDYVVAGAMNCSHSFQSDGAAYVFKKDQGGAGNWGQVARLQADDPNESAYFGWSVAIDGDYVVVGAPANDIQGVCDTCGSAYIFEKDFGGTDNWGFSKRLRSASPTLMDNFGQSVGVSGNYVIVGVPGDDTLGTNAGAAYIFWGPSTWGFAYQAIGADVEENDAFGSSVAIDGDYAVIGAIGDDAPFENSGSAYVFYGNQHGPGQWGQHDKLLPASTTQNSKSGYSVSISGDYAVVGSPGDGSEYAHVFQRSGSFWSRVTKLAASDLGSEDVAFGWSVSISGRTVIAGAPQDSSIAPSSGSAYFFDDEPGIASPTAIVTGHTTATLGATVTHSGWYDLTARGVVWSRTPDPTIATNEGSAANPGNEGTFTVPATGLQTGDTYHYRAYATSTLGTAYTDDATFVAGDFVLPGSLRVTLLPSAAHGAGAAWKLSGGSTWYASEHTLAGLTPGTYTVVFKDAVGWIAPGARSAYVYENQLTEITASYVNKVTSGDLTVNFNSTSAILSGVKWRIKGAADSATPPVDFTRWRGHGESIALEAGSYIVEFMPTPGWIHTETEVKIKAGVDASVEAAGIPFLVSACTDFDGDGCGDMAVFNPTTRVWTVKDGLEKRFGLRGSWPTAGDYDGDGDADLAYWRPKKGIWRVRGQFKLKGFGMEGDLPVPGDYDGDGLCDPALYRPSTGEWLLVLSGDASAPGKADVTVLKLGGAASEIPVPADYDGDGTTDTAVFNLETRTWRFEGGGDIRYGRAGELPVPGDYNGDGVADLAVVNTTKESWRVRGQFKLDIDCEPGVFPLLLDHDGDGLPEPGYYLFEDGCWHVFTFGKGAGRSWVTETKFNFGDETVLPLWGGR